VAGGARRPTLAAQLAHAELAVAGDTLEIAYAPGDNLVASALARAANREVLDSAVASVVGAGARWRPLERAGARRTRSNGAGATDGRGAGQSDDPAATATTAVRPGTAAAAPELVAHPRVQAVLEIFGGSVSGVELDDRERREREPE
jgi:hypothetical protein